MSKNKDLKTPKIEYISCRNNKQLIRKREIDENKLNYNEIE